MSNILHHNILQHVKSAAIPISKQSIYPINLDPHKKQ